MSKKIRIMYIINNLTVGGAETLLHIICKGLVQKICDYEVKVVALENINALSPRFEELGIEVICLDVRKKNFIIRVIKIYQAIRKYNPRLVHTHLLTSDGPGQIAAFFAGIKKRICTIHSVEDKGIYKERLIRFFTSIFATNIIAVSNSTKNFCIKKKFYPSKKFTVIHNSPGFEVKDIKPKSLNNKAKQIKLINVGRLFKMKGHIYLIKAMHQLMSRYADIELDIYGEGPEEKKLRNEVLKLNINNVVFRGVTNNVMSVLMGADIFIATSLWEGFHMSVVEAMSCGLPVILTDIPAHRELLQDIQDYPFFIKPADSEVIKEAILSLINSPGLYNELSKKCINQSKKFSISAMIDNYNNFYKSLII